jgi:hypothetical protein
LFSSPEVELEAGKSGILKIVPKSEARALVSAVQEALQREPPDPAGTVSEASVSKRGALRRTEDRIRGFCMQLLTAKNDKEVEAMLLGLQKALHRHVENFRTRLGDYPAMQERRVRSVISAGNAAEQESGTANNVIAMANGATEPGVTPGRKISNG